MNSLYNVIQLRLPECEQNHCNNWTVQLNYRQNATENILLLTNISPRKC